MRSTFRDQEKENMSKVNNFYLLLRILLKVVILNMVKSFLIKQIKSASFPFNTSSERGIQKQQ